MNRFPFPRPCRNKMTPSPIRQPNGRAGKGIHGRRPRPADSDAWPVRSACFPVADHMRAPVPPPVAVNERPPDNPLAVEAIRFAPSRNDPLASAGRSAFTLRGSDPPRQLRPALVCPWHDPLLLCEASSSAFGSLRFGSADPLRHVWLTTRCAGNPLAAAGPIPGPGALAPRLSLPPRPETLPVPQPKGNRAEAVSAAGPSLAGPTPATSFDGRTA